MSVYKRIGLVTLAITISVELTDSFWLTILRVNDCKNRSHLKSDRITLKVKFILVRNDMHMNFGNLVEFEHLCVLCPDSCLWNDGLVCCC